MKSPDSLIKSKEMAPEKVGYQENYEFWTEKGDKLTVMGDFLGRVPSAELLKPRTGEKILDAGCGAGFMARIYARNGAEVVGIDREESMLSQAIKEEKKENLGIKFVQGDIADLPFKEEQFDAVSCVAVLIHDSPEECKKFFDTAYKVLKPGGRIVVSITHPRLYHPDSPNRKDKTSWVQHSPIEDKPLTESQKFEEIYRNAEGKEFKSTVWYHPEDLFPEQLKEAGFCVVHTQSTYVTPEVLKGSNQTGEVGYPAFYQILAEKIEK